jgi:hypothetical protein
MTNAIRWVLSISALPVAAAFADGPHRLAVNLNLHSQIEIERPAAAIWPHIMEPNSWKPDRKLVHYAGPEGQIGEVFAIGGTGNGGKIWFLVENVEIVPNLRRTIKMYDPEGHLLGFSTWLLTELDGRTIVAYDVHGESVLSSNRAKETTSESIAVQERDGHEVNKKRIDAELVTLKRLVEAQ